MKVKLLVGRASVNDAQSPGEIIEVSDAEGARLVEKGRAEPVIEQRKETATRAPSERRKRK